MRGTVFDEEYEYETIYAKELHLSHLIILHSFLATIGDFSVLKHVPVLSDLY